MDLLKELRLDDLSEEQREIAIEIGLDSYIKLSYLCGGTRPYIAKMTENSKKARNRRIKEEYDGGNVKYLAIKYNLTEEWIRKIVFEDIKKRRNNNKCQ